MTAKVVTCETTTIPEMTNGLNITRMEHKEKTGSPELMKPFRQSFIYLKKTARGVLQRSRLLFAEKQTNRNSFKIEMHP